MTDFDFTDEPEPEPAPDEVGEDQVLFVHRDGRKVAVPRGSMTERRYRRFSAWREA
jgi:hypothetical protein